jgi:hypothetical protein
MKLRALYWNQHRTGGLKACPTPRALVFFLSATLLSASILTGCVGVTTSKGNFSTTDSTSTASSALSASPAAVDFGNVPVGATINQSLTISNSSTAAVTISQVSISGTGFTIGGVALPVTLNSGVSATFTASFAPSAPGDVTGNASFVSPQLRQGFGVGWHGTGKSVAPSISGQPVSQSIPSGETATFSVTAKGTGPLSYQWSKNGTAISGATSTSYTTPAETTSDNGAQFSVVVGNSTGSVISNTATLTVTPAPVAPSITTQPANQTTLAGQTATFSVTANGTSPLSYQWWKNGTAISGATSASYTTSAETTSDNGAIFSIVVSNSAGSVTSNNARLTVNPDPVAPSIASQPASQTITAGQTATFSVTASGTTPLSYQWRKNGTAVSGATSSSYTTPAETTGDNGAQFSVVISNSAGSATSNSAVLTVNAAPVAPSITTQPASQTITAGQTATFSVTASGTAPLSYQWQKNGVAISGATSTSYTTPAETTSDNGAQFSVVVGNSAGSATSNSAVLTVNAAPVAPSITTQPASQTITAGQTATFSVTASGTAPLSYQWNKNRTAISGATSSSYTTPAETTGDNGAQFSVVISNSAGNATSNAAALTVNSTTFLLSASPTSLNFGNINTGASRTLAFTLSDAGNSAVSISNVSISGAGFTASGMSAGTVLNPGQTATVNVTFAPASTGSVLGSVTITSSATNSPATVSLSGSGILPTFTLWVAPSLTRVGQTDTPGTVSSANLSGARGETVDTQVIVRAPAGGLTSVNMTASALTGPGGATIAASNITFYREYYVSMTGSTSGGGSNPPLGSGTYAEPLIPFVDPETGAALSGSLRAVPATVTANQNQPFWVDLFIPRGASNSPQGTYTGTITVTSDQGSVLVPVTLTVWNFELPLAPSEKSLFLIWTSSSTAYQQSLLRNKIAPWEISASQASSEIANFGLNRAGLDGSLYVGIQCNGSYSSIPTQAQIASLAATYPAGLALDLYVADENVGCTASYPPIQQVASNAHASGVKILDTIAPVSALYGSVDYWAMLPGEWPSSLSGIPGSFWSYASCDLGNGNYPGWMIDFPPINERLNAGFLNQMEGATGLLYWRADNWTAGDAIGSWNNPPTSGCGVSRPGDGLMIYPPSPIGSTEPAPGIRLKALRDGIQDYEYVQILNGLGQAAFVNSVIQPIATNWNNWTHDPNALEAARIQLGQQLNLLSPP